MRLAGTQGSAIITRLFPDTPWRLHQVRISTGVCHDGLLVVQGFSLCSLSLLFHADNRARFKSTDVVALQIQDARNHLMRALALVEDIEESHSFESAHKILHVRH